MELVNVYDEYKQYGVQIIGFPCAQFLFLEDKQTPEEMIEFARVKMGAQFPIMAKCDVNGPDAHPVYKYLRRVTGVFRNEETGKIRNIPWNFTRFFLDS